MEVVIVSLASAKVLSWMPLSWEYVEIATVGVHGGPAVERRYA
jgi:hypothetical protein